MNSRSKLDGYSAIHEIASLLKYFQLGIIIPVARNDNLVERLLRPEYSRLAMAEIEKINKTKAALKNNHQSR